MKNNRKEEFDVLRTLIIISAIVLHYNSRFGLGILAFPSIFVQKQIFNVGSFFFFTSGYMAHQIYLVKFQNNGVKTTLKIWKKGLEIFLLYIGYINFMRLSIGASIPTNLYDFIYDHKFYTKVLFTFAILYLVSPILIALYSRAKYLFLLLIFLLFSIYSFWFYFPISATLINSEIVGIFLGMGNKQVYYPFIPAIITYGLGFLVAAFEQQLIFKAYQLKILSWVSLSILVLHSLLIKSSTAYKYTMNLQLIELLATSIFIFLSLILTRRLLLLKTVKSILNKKAVILVGTKSLTFYITSNMILGFLSFPPDSIMLGKIIVFLLLFLLTYLITAWHFYSDYYGKLLRNGSTS